MGVDFYGALQLTRNCEDLDIKQAYRRLAVICLNEGKTEQLELVSEAYDVLSEPCRRALYDQYGEEGLKRGIPTSDGFILPYTYHGDVIKTLKDFFGTSNPYIDLIQQRFSPEELFTFPLGQGIREKEPQLERPLALTLEEVFHGCVKKMKILRNVFDDESEETTKLQEKILTIPIKKGLPPGTTFEFSEVGDQGHTIIPANVIFVTEDKKHPVFWREGLNLITNKTLSLQEALVGFTLPLTTIDGRVLNVAITEVVSPGYQKILVGEGMPDCNHPFLRGDMIINFTIEFPKYIPKQNKKLIIRALKEPELQKDKDLNHLVHKKAN